MLNQLIHLLVVNTKTPKLKGAQNVFASNATLENSGKILKGNIFKMYGCVVLGCLPG